MAAGCLLITEAGGLVGDLEGNETQLESGQIIAGNPKIFGQLLQVIAPHLTPALIEMQRTENLSDRILPVLQKPAPDSCRWILSRISSLPVVEVLLASTDSDHPENAA